MSDYTTVRKHLLEICDLPGINEFIPELWDLIEKNKTELGDDFFLKTFIEKNKQYIFNELTDAPKGLSVNRKKIPQFIVLIILVLDGLEFYNNNTFWEKYLDFRFKAFMLFVDNNLDADAACIFDSLREIRNSIEYNTPLHKRINHQLKIYSKRIKKRLEDSEKRNNYNEAQFLNSIYSLHPEYEFESRLQEKESKYIRLPFFEIMIEIVIPIVLLSALLGVNAIFKSNGDNNIIAYFTKDDFTFNDIIIGFFVIYLTFWVFKLLEYSKLSVRLTIFFKVFIIVAIIVSTLLFVKRQYKTQELRYFPKEVNIDTIPKEITRVLITEFNNIEERSIFDKNNSEIKISQLFYKKILERNEHNLWNTDSIIFDYSSNNLKFKTEQEFKDKQKKVIYDVIVSGDIFRVSSNNEDEKGELYISNSCYFPDSLFKHLIETFDKQKSKFEKTEYNFLTYYNSPLVYYEDISPLEDITIKLKSDIGYICGLTNYRIQGSFPQGVSFLNSVNNSPLIIYYYVSLLHLWKECESKKFFSKESLDNIIYCIDNISSISGNEEFKSSIKLKSNSEFKIHLNLLKSYFINESIKKCFNEKGEIVGKNKENEAFNLWALKIELMAKAIEESLMLNDIRQDKIDFLIASFYYVNYEVLAEVLNLYGRINVSSNKYNENYSNILRKNVLRIFNNYEQKYDSLPTYSDSYFSSYFNEMEITLKFHINKDEWPFLMKSNIDSVSKYLKKN